MGQGLGKNKTNWDDFIKGQSTVKGEVKQTKPATDKEATKNGGGTSA